MPRLSLWIRPWHFCKHVSNSQRLPWVCKCPALGLQEHCECPTARTDNMSKCPAVAWGRGDGHCWYCIDWLTTLAWKGAGCARFYTMCFPANIHTIPKETGNSKGEAISRGIWGGSNQWTLCGKGMNIYWSGTAIIIFSFSLTLALLIIISGFFWCFCKQTGDTVKVLYLSFGQGEPGP